MNDKDDSRFGSPKSLINYYESQLRRYIKLGIGECTYDGESVFYGPSFNGVIVSENLINATRRRIVQLKTPFIKVYPLPSMGQNGQFRLKKNVSLR